MRREVGMVRTSVEQGRDETTIELKRDSCDGPEKHWSEGDLEQQIGSERRLVKSIVSPARRWRTTRADDYCA